MALRAQPASTDTRDRLLKAAKREFALRGYKGASLRQICASAGVTTGALYFFFKNKEDLFRTVVEPVMEPLVQMLSASVDHEVPLSARTPVVDGARDVPEVARNFLELCAKHDDVVKIMTRDRDNPVMELLVSEVAAELADEIHAGLIVPRAGRAVVEDRFVADWLAGTCVRSVIQIIGAEGTFEDSCRRMGVVFNFILTGISGL